jgi:ABC-type Na+ efflux pump permease subunit
MRMHARRIRAVLRKELREYRRNGTIVASMIIFPLMFMIQPLVVALVVPASAAGSIRHEHLLIYMLAIPALVPAAVAAFGVVGERQQGTLEPVLTTPVSREEFLLAKGLAAFVPSVAVAYLAFGLFVAVVEIFAQPGIAHALLRAPYLLAQVLYTPLLAGWSIWIGLAISARCRDTRVAQQLGLVANLPAVAVTSLVAFNVIPNTPMLAFGGAAALLVFGGLGWRLVAAIFDRERLITAAA